MDKIKIAIADDNRELVSLMSDYLGSQPNMEVVAIAYNGKMCINMLKEHQVDVLLLDVIMPYLDGIAVLDAIKENENLKNISVIMLSAFGQEAIMSQAAEYGASYFIMKPFEAERLAMQINHIMQNQETVSDPKAEKKLRDEQINNFIKEIGIPPHLNGYAYLKEAISLVLDEPEMLNKVTKSLYPGVAEKFDTTPPRVERSIRNAIEIAWNNNEIEQLSKIFGYNEEHLETKPPNSQFIAMVAESLKFD
ncbi:two-component system response regulator (stage 0 sporulation protein A) [Planomicrobium soli]|uniref:Stage 0 sporulation protein A homolog n=1 Tax=Planomicrobium soli TaxID=1176648 RepID=A0A2P8H4I3_9BACL|nr:sporulation transcription factor Spo0A [Planomicrobium soli]PSL41124.1 two-component system response regulator (stage 0 sporulation protein A) [Planomicrobium soli]